MSEWGVFAVDRGIWGDPDFAAEPFTEREAWMWLISGAAWKAIKLGHRGLIVELERSEFCFSLRFLATKWQWKKDRVARFLDRLEKRDIIRDTSRMGAKVYKIKNYNRFQVVGLPERDKNATVTATAPRQHRDKEETFKHSNIEDNHHERAEALLPRLCEILRIELQSDPSRITWPRQVEEMLRDGLTEAQIIAATERARANGKPNLAYIRAIAFNPPKEKPNERPLSPQNPKPSSNLNTLRALAKVAGMGDSGPEIPGGDEAQPRPDARNGAGGSPVVDGTFRSIPAGDAGGDRGPTRTSQRAVLAAKSDRGDGRAEMGGLLRGALSDHQRSARKGVQSMVAFAELILPETRSIARSGQGGHRGFEPAQGGPRESGRSAGSARGRAGSGRNVCDARGITYLTPPRNRKATMPMEHPYNSLYTAKETAILAGAHTQMPGDQSTLEHRLREMAFYLTERQQTGADAMFVMDLHEAADMIGRKGKYHPSHDLRTNRSSTG